MKLRDWIIAFWVALSGVAFVLVSLAAVHLFAGGKSPVEELLAAGRYVYVTVIAICLIGVALRVAQNLGNINWMDK